MKRRSGSIWHKLHRFAGTGAQRRFLLLEAVFWLAAARIVLLVLPFPRIAKHIGIFTPPAEGLTYGSPPDPVPAEAVLATEIGWAVTRAARHVPFKAVCLPQGLAAKHMLRRRGVTSVLYFGAAKDSAGQLGAHAWLQAAGVEVTGYPVANGFTPMACFV